MVSESAFDMQTALFTVENLNMPFTTQFAALIRLKNTIFTGIFNIFILFVEYLLLFLRTTCIIFPLCFWRIIK